MLFIIYILCLLSSMGKFKQLGEVNHYMYLFSKNACYFYNLKNIDFYSFCCLLRPNMGVVTCTSNLHVIVIHNYQPNQILRTNRE